MSNLREWNEMQREAAEDLGLVEPLPARSFCDLSESELAAMRLEYEADLEEARKGILWDNFVRFLNLVIAHSNDPDVVWAALREYAEYDTPRAYLGEWDELPF